MTVFKLKFLGISAITLTLVIGCGSTEDAPLVSEPKPISADDASQDLTNESNEAKDGDASDKSAEARPNKRFLLADFEPPYPNRINPFATPSRTMRQTQRNDSSESSVVLIGFAKLDEQKAILDIDGVVSPLANGDIYAGVEVIAIEPPNAVLQRGRDRWTASIE